MYSHIATILSFFIALRSLLRTTCLKRRHQNFGIRNRSKTTIIEEKRHQNARLVTQTVDINLVNSYFHSL